MQRPWSRRQMARVGRVVVYSAVEAMFRPPALLLLPEAVPRDRDALANQQPLYF